MRRALLHQAGPCDGLNAVPHHHPGGGPAQDIVALHAFDLRPRCLVFRLDRAGPTRCWPAGLLRAHARTVCAGVLRHHTHLLQTREEHLVHVCTILETLRHRKLYAEASKFQFSRSSVGFLGHVISLTISSPLRNGRRRRRVRTCTASLASPSRRQLLPQVCLTLLRHCSPAHCPLKPPG